MAAPTSEIMRFAIVRPPLREVAADAARTQILISPSKSLASEASVEQRKQYGERLDSYVADAGPVIARGTKLLGELRSADQLDYMDADALKTLRDAFAAPDDDGRLVAALGDAYLISIDNGDTEAAAQTGKALRAVHALTMLPQVDGDDVIALSSAPLVLARTRTVAEDVVEQVDNAETARLRLETARDLVLWSVSLTVVDAIIAAGAFKAVREGDPLDQPAQPVEPDGKGIGNSRWSPGKLLATPALSERVGDAVGDFLKAQLAGDIDHFDLVALRELALAGAVRGMTNLSSGLAATDIRAFDAALTKAVDAIRTNPAADLEALVRPLAVGDVKPQFVRTTQRVLPQGIADLKVVRQQLQRYQLGEVAHIENVLKGEKRSRTHHQLERLEQIYVVEEEETSTSQKDLQTTERFELAQETQRIIEEKRKLEAGLNVSASYGIVSVSADARMTDERSAQESAKVARNYARETISKASESLEKRKRSQTTSTTIFETSEKNVHAFEAPTESISGVYRWVEKKFWCQTFNYGARLTFRLEIPEPAAFYLYALSSGNDAAPGLTAPAPPAFKAADLSEYNYQAFAAPYGATVAAPPPAYQFSIIGTAQGKEAADNSDEKFEVEIPSDYEMWSVQPMAGWRVQGNNSAFQVVVAPYIWNSSNLSWDERYFSPPVRGKFQIGVNSVYVEHFAVSLIARLRRTADAFARWQLATFNAIQEAYLAQKSDYDRRLTATAVRRQVISARTDQEYRDIERVELKRACIQLITGDDFSKFGSMQHPPKAPPYLDVADAIAEGNFVRFVEDSLEWDQMVYTFAPYFWGGKERRESAYGSDNQDPVFQRFLRAGFASVVLPVKPGSEQRMLYYAETGTVWSGDDPPILNDPAHIAMIKESEASNGEIASRGIPEGNPWEQSVPTNLVCLEIDGAKLPSWEINFPDATDGYVPSRKTCRGEPYNVKQWPEDLKAVRTTLIALGFAIPEARDAPGYFKSSNGMAMVRAFQVHANREGVANALGRPLGVDGVLGPCTLRGLTAANAMLVAGQWTRPN